MNRWLVCGFLSCLFLMNAGADRVCLQSKIATGKVKHTVQTVTGANKCPKGFVEFLNTETLGTSLGATGSTGATGITGRTGVTGVTGATGAFVGSTLPAGQTLRGTYGSFVSVSGSGEYVGGSETFVLSLPSEPIVHFIDEGGATTSECPGTVAQPEAQAGHLCVYESAAHNRSAVVIFNPSTGLPGASRFGFGLYANSAAAGSGYVSTYGTFAVTAP